jgi:hypothetical protein
MQEPFDSSSFQPIDRNSLQSGKHFPIAAIVAVIVVCTIGLTLVNAHDGASGAPAPASSFAERADGNVVQITLFESAMGPMIGASIVAIQHGLNPPLITLLVGVGITASFLSLPLWWYVLQGV